jgi:proteic killer suppression protein
MIRTFRHKALADLFYLGRTAKIDAKMVNRIKFRLDTLNEATSTEDLKIPGYDFHALKGIRPTRYTIHVNGPWCITFEFVDGDAYRVDYEQYH